VGLGAAAVVLQNGVEDVGQSRGQCAV
jgi:hypothetical protein